MKKADKASISIRKVVGICLILLFVMGIGVMAANTKLNNVKIILSNGYEMNVLTAKSNVSEILEENHIILLPDEKVIPNKESELSENNTIKITKQTEEEVEVAEIAEKSEDVSVDSLLKNYDSIIEKIVTEQVVIPFETVTKDVSDGATTRTDKVVQQGKDGLKEVTYKIKYQNEVEIERVEISSVVIKEPVNKIVEVRKQQVTSRSSVSRDGVVSYSGNKWSYSASEMDLLCAITAQECNSSYSGALAVITTACNRTESSRWRSKGSDPLTQYKARGQFCYSIDSHWKRRLNGNYPSYVVQAVQDALDGKRNHNYVSFRSSSSGVSGINIGGNVYFNSK